MGIIGKTSAWMEENISRGPVETEVDDSEPSAEAFAAPAKQRGDHCESASVMMVILGEPIYLLSWCTK